MAAQWLFKLQNIAVLGFKCLVLSDGLTDFHNILHVFSTWSGVDTCLVRFFIKFKMAAQWLLLLQNIAVLAFKRQELRDGWAGFHKILLDFSTWCGVDTCLF